MVAEYSDDAEFISYGDDGMVRGPINRGFTALELDRIEDMALSAIDEAIVILGKVERIRKGLV